MLRSPRRAGVAGPPAKPRTAFLQKGRGELLEMLVYAGAGAASSECSVVCCSLRGRRLRGHMGSSVAVTHSLPGARRPWCCSPWWAQRGCGGSAGQVQAGAGRCGQVQAGVGRCRQVRAGAGRHWTGAGQVGGRCGEGAGRPASGIVAPERVSRHWRALRTHPAVQGPVCASVCGSLWHVILGCKAASPEEMKHPSPCCQWWMSFRDSKGHGVSGDLLR